MKKALFILENLNNSGSPLTALHVAQVAKSNCEVDFLVLCGKDKNDLKRIDSFKKISRKIEICFFPPLLSRKFKLFYFFYLNKIICKIKKLFKNDVYDAIYINRFYICGYIAKFIKKRYQTKVIFNSLGKISNGTRIPVLRFFIKRSVKYLCKYSDYFVGISSKCLPSFNEKEKCKMMVIHDYSELEPLSFPKEFSCKGKVSLGQIGYYSNLKNQLFALKLLKNILSKGLDAHLFFVGFALDKKYFKNMKKVIFDNNLTEKVTFFDANYNKKDFFSNIDLLLLPSYTEGFPITIIEALTQKTFVLSSLAISKESDYGNLERIDIGMMEEWEKFVINESYKRDLSNSINLKEKFVKDFKECFK